MGRFVAGIRAFALAFGAPGLFMVAALDSSFLSLPEIADLLVVWMVTQHKSRLGLYVAAATLGSLAGCLVMYFIGRKGGEALIRRRFVGSNVERARAALQRHGLVAVLIPAILPPPAPFKIFVLLAGGAGIEVSQFTVAVVLGRGLRYLVLGILAIEYGDRAMGYFAEHFVFVSLLLIGTVAFGLASYLVWIKMRQLRHR